MDIKVNQQAAISRLQQEVQKPEVDSDFKFTLASKIEEKDFQAKIHHVLEEIALQGKKISKRRDIRDMKIYRTLIAEFMNEIVNRSHKFSRENFLDKKGRHRIYTMIKLVDKNLDELAIELLKDEKDNLSILNKIDEIRGLLLDILT